MSKKVFTEPERLRKFANNLKGFRSNIDDLNSQIRRNLSHLSESWRDQEFDSFIRSFESVQQKLRKFSDEVEHIVPNLERDAKRADDYINIQTPNI
jgi:uncharacterized protein YukE